MLSECVIAESLQCQIILDLQAEPIDLRGAIAVKCGICQYPFNNKRCPISFCRKRGDGKADLQNLRKRFPTLLLLAKILNESTNGLTLLAVDVSAHRPDVGIVRKTFTGCATPALISKGSSS